MDLSSLSKSVMSKEISCCILTSKAALSEQRVTTKGIFNFYLSSIAFDYYDMILSRSNRSSIFLTFNSSKKLIHASSVLELLLTGNWFEN